MLNWLLSILVHKDILKLEEAEHLSKELVVKTHPQNFMDAHKIVAKIFKDFENK